MVEHEEKNEFEEPTDECPSFADLESKGEESIEAAIAWTQDIVDNIECMRSQILDYEAKISLRVASPANYDFPSGLTEEFEKRKVTSAVGTLIDKLGVMKESLEASLQGFEIKAANTKSTPKPMEQMSLSEVSGD
jgi:hypothetical protein